jgi:hypothetical protein
MLPAMIGDSDIRAAAFQNEPGMGDIYRIRFFKRIRDKLVQLFPAPDLFGSGKGMKLLVALGGRVRDMEDMYKSDLRLLLFRPLYGKSQSRPGGG